MLKSGGFVVSAFGVATRSADWPGYVGSHTVGVWVRHSGMPPPTPAP